MENVVATPRRGVEHEADLETDPELAALFEERQKLASFQPIGASRPAGGDWDAPLDLRVHRPVAVDLRRVWRATKAEAPPTITAALGPRIPVLLHHVVTPFAIDGRIPGAVWGLGYEFVNESADASTVAVLPTDELLKIGSIGQDVDVGLDLRGGVGVPGEALDLLDGVPGLSLSGASVRATVGQEFQFRLRMTLSLRKVVGAPVGAGGALWKMYRQDEPLDRPHTLLQTVLVAEGTREIRCTVKTWARQAGLLGTRLGAKFWSYDDEEFIVSLEGLGDP
jgi:hypothetical protein